MFRSLRARLFGGKKLTFLYVPDNASVRQFMVPKVAFYGFGAFIVASLGLTGFFGSRYLSAAGEGRQMLQLRGENLQLRDHLGDLQRQLASLQGEMKTNLEIQQRLRLVASLQDLDPEVLEAGVGGPSPRLSATAGCLPTSAAASRPPVSSSPRCSGRSRCSATATTRSWLPCRRSARPGTTRRRCAR
jgi:hypothetical protein